MPVFSFATMHTAVDVLLLRISIDWSHPYTHALLTVMCDIAKMQYLSRGSTDFDETNVFNKVIYGSFEDCRLTITMRWSDNFRNTLEVCPTRFLILCRKPHSVTFNNLKIFHFTGVDINMNRTVHRLHIAYVYTAVSVHRPYPLSSAVHMFVPAS
jgi:hypothetical protein